MTRKKSKNGSTPGVIHTYQGRREQVFTTSLGVEVWVGPLPPMMPDIIRANVEDDWQAAGRALPVKPTYETVNVAGDKQTFEHDADSLTTDEEKAAYATYLKLTQEFEEAVMAATFEEHARNGIRFEINPEWVKRYARLRPPSDPDELRWFYTRAAVIGSREDVLHIMTIASRLTGVDEQLIQAAENSFLRQVEEANAAPQVKDA